jgi:hypothetical protein
MPLKGGVVSAPDDIDARREIMGAIRRLRASQTVQDCARKFLRLQQKMRQQLAEEAAEGIRVMTSSLTSATSSEEPCKKPAADEMVLLWTDIITAPKTLNFEAPRARRPTVPTPCGASGYETPNTVSIRKFAKHFRQVAEKAAAEWAAAERAAAEKAAAKKAAAQEAAAKKMKKAADGEAAAGQAPTEWWHPLDWMVFDQAADEKAAEKAGEEEAAAGQAAPKEWWQPPDWMVFDKAAVENASAEKAAEEEAAAGQAVPKEWWQPPDWMSPPAAQPAVDNGKAGAEKADEAEADAAAARVDALLALLVGSSEGEESSTPDELAEEAMANVDADMAQVLAAVAEGAMVATAYNASNMRGPIPECIPEDLSRPGVLDRDGAREGARDGARDGAREVLARRSEAPVRETSKTAAETAAEADAAAREWLAAQTAADAAAEAAEAAAMLAEAVRESREARMRELTAELHTAHETVDRLLEVVEQAGQCTKASAWAAREAAMRRQLAAAEARTREAEARAQALHAEPGVVVVVAEAALEETAVSPCRLPLPTADDPAAVSPPSPSKKKLGPATPKRGSGGYIGGFTTIVPEPELEPVRAAPSRGGYVGGFTTFGLEPESGPLRAALELTRPHTEPDHLSSGPTSDDLWRDNLHIPSLPPPTTNVPTARATRVKKVVSKPLSALMGVWRGIYTVAETVADAAESVSHSLEQLPIKLPLGKESKMRRAALERMLSRSARKLRNLEMSRAFNSWIALNSWVSTRGTQLVRTWRAFNLWADLWRRRSLMWQRLRTCTHRFALLLLAEAFNFWQQPPMWVSKYYKCYEGELFEEYMNRAERWRRQRAMYRAWRSWVLQRQTRLQRAPLVLRARIGEVYLRLSRVHRGWYCWVAEWERLVSIALARTNTRSDIFSWLQREERIDHLAYGPSLGRASPGATDEYVEYDPALTRDLARESPDQSSTSPRATTSRVLRGVGQATDYLVRSIGVTSRTASFTRGVAVRSRSLSPRHNSALLGHKQDTPNSTRDSAWDSPDQGSSTSPRATTSRVLRGVGQATDYLVRSIGVTSRTASFTRGVTERSVSMSVSPPLDSDPHVHKEDKHIKTPAKSTSVNSSPNRTALDRMAAMRV